MAKPDKKKCKHFTYKKKPVEQPLYIQEKICRASTSYRRKKEKEENNLGSESHSPGVWAPN